MGSHDKERRTSLQNAPGYWRVGGGGREGGEEEGRQGGREGGREGGR